MSWLVSRDGAVVHVQAPDGSTYHLPLGVADALHLDLVDAINDGYDELRDLGEEADFERRWT